MTDQTNQAQQRVIIPAAEVEALQKRYNLHHQVPFSLEAAFETQLAGKRVLEVGGSLPPDYVFDVLKPRQWVAVEEPGYWTEIHAHDQLAAKHNVHPIAEVTSAAMLSDYTVLLGGIEDLSPGLFGQFDVIVSFAAFEHILELGRALSAMRNALTPGGCLFAKFSPVWSAHNGHHLPEVVDKRGRKFSFGSKIIPPWGHLLMRPPALYSHLRQFTDADAASRIVYYVHHSPHINRLFVEDYIEYVKNSDLAGVIRKFAVNAPSQKMEARLRHLYPDNTLFGPNGLTVHLWPRPAAES